MAIEVVMPEMGEGVIEGTISRWLKQEGDRVEEFEPILEIETDKVTTEATAEDAGTLLKIYVAEGETVPVGTVLALIGEPGEALPDEGGEAAGEEAAPARTAGTRAAGHSNGGPAREAPVEAGPEDEMPYAGWASPVVKRIAAEHAVDLNRVEGTGRGGRITKKDILAYLEMREKVEAAPQVEEAPAARLAPQPAAEPTAKRAPEPPAGYPASCCRTRTCAAASPSTWSPASAPARTSRPYLRPTFRASSPTARPIRRSLSAVAPA